MSFIAYPPQKEELSAATIECRTFRLDCIRFIFQGFVDVVFKNYVLLIAIRIFHTSERVKGLLVASAYIGLTLTPLVLRFFTQICPLKTNHVLAFLLSIVGIAVGIAIGTEHGLVFVIAIMIAKIFYKQTLPFVTEIYNRNYPRERRGRIVGKLFTILAISGIIFAYFCGYLLDHSPLGYRWILYLTALSLFCCGYVFLQVPNGQVLLRDSESFFRSNLSILLNDRLFTLILCLWSLTSIAFQMTFPLRVEYLANQGYGFNLSNGDITLIIVTIPTITRVASAFFWGKIFDMRHFAVMKVMIIICYLASIPLFFFTKNFTLWGISAVALGLGYGGNLMAWQLWVLKIAPPERLGAYVSINVAVTGIRDAIAAALGYYLLSCAISLHTIAFSAIILTIISLIGFCFLLRHPRLR